MINNNNITLDTVLKVKLYSAGKYWYILKNDKIDDNNADVNGYLYFRLKDFVAIFGDKILGESSDGTPSVESIEVIDYSIPDDMLSKYKCGECIPESCVFNLI